MRGRHQDHGAAIQIVCNILCTVCCSPREQLVAMAVVSVVVVFFLTRSVCFCLIQLVSSCPQTTVTQNKPSNLAAAAWARSCSRPLASAW